MGLKEGKKTLAKNKHVYLGIILVLGILVLNSSGAISLSGITNLFTGGGGGPGPSDTFPCPYNDGLSFGTQLLLNQHIAAVHGTIAGPGAAALQWTARNKITRASITTPDVTFIVANDGVFDFMTLYDYKASDSAPEQSNEIFAEGAEIIAMIEDDADPSGGTDYYDG